MLLDEFLIKLGTVVDSSGVDKMTDSLKKADKEAKKTDEAVKKAAYNWKEAWASVANVAKGIVAGVDKYTNVIVGVLDEFMNVADAKQKKLLDKSKKQVLELNRQFHNLFTDLKRMILFEALPYLLKIIEKIQDWIKNNRELIDKGLVFLKNRLEDIAQLARNFLKFIDRFIGWKNAIMLVVGAFVLLKKTMIFGKAMGALKFLLSPLGLLAIAIGVILLLIDDLMVYLNGGESYFGKAWDPIIEMAKEVKEAIGDIVTAIKEWWDESGPAIIEGLSRILGFFAFVLRAIVGFVKDNLGIVKNIFKAAFKVIASVIKIIANVFKLVMAWIAGDFEATDSALRAIWDGFLSFLQGIGDFIINVFALAGEALYAMFEEKIDALFALWDDFKNKLHGLWDEIKIGIQEIWDSLPEWAQNAINKLISTCVSAVDRIIGIFKPITSLFGLSNEIGKGLGNVGMIGLKGAKTGGGNTTNNSNVNITNNVRTNNQQVARMFIDKNYRRSTELAKAPTIG